MNGIIVSHTHWDRAWYLPFQSFRFRLVRTVDRLLDLLESDEDFQAFTLDGQTVLLEDYLALRPQQTQRLRLLIQQQRIFLGPWYTMPDLFLASGEAIIRNLQRGKAWGDALGGYLAVGYVPDSFGHFAQMPQILRRFGIDSYIFMRGLDKATKQSHGAIFQWEAPDGSTVLATYLARGYFSAGAVGHPLYFGRFEGHVPDLDLAKQRLYEEIEAIAALQEEETFLLCNGFDHMPPQKELPEILRQLNLPGTSLKQGTFSHYLAALGAEGKTHRTYRGDLLGNADHPILSSVYSTRLYLKQQNHRAQQALIQYAEPLSAWLAWQGLGESVRPFLDEAWRLLLQNHAHDNLCGCSVDPVHEDDEYRFRQVEQIAESILIEGLEQLLMAGLVPRTQGGEPGSNVWLFNPHPWEETYRIETSILFPNPEGEWGKPLPERELIGYSATEETISITTLKTEAPVVRSRFLETTWGRRYHIQFCATLPPLGYQVVQIREKGEPQVKDCPTTLAIANDCYRLAVENDGLTLTETATGTRLLNLLNFEYELDDGDTYSFSPVPGFSPRRGKFIGANWHPEKPQTLCLNHQLIVPAGYDRHRGAWGETTLAIATEVALDRRNVTSIVRYCNTAKNGRLRAIFPIGFATNEAIADGHFRLVSHRQHSPNYQEDRTPHYPGERDYPTHHQGDFVFVESNKYRLWLANRGLPEYELLQAEANTSIAITLHRAVGYLSVNRGGIRTCQAGPSVPTPQAQCQREIEANLALGLGQLEPEAIIRQARKFAHPAIARELPYLPYVRGNAHLKRSLSFLAIDNPTILLSAMKLTDDEKAIVLRLFNTSDKPQTGSLHIGFQVTQWCPTDLQEIWDNNRACQLDSEEIAIAFSPHQIQTILLR